MKLQRFFSQTGLTGCPHHALQAAPVTWPHLISSDDHCLADEQCSLTRWSQGPRCSKIPFPWDAQKCWEVLWLVLKMGWAHPRDGVSTGTPSAQQHGQAQSNQCLGVSLGVARLDLAARAIPPPHQGPGLPRYHPRDRDGHCRGCSWVCPYWPVVCCVNLLSIHCIFSQWWLPHYSTELSPDGKDILQSLFFTLSAFFNNADEIPGWRQSMTGRNGSKQSSHSYSPMGNKISFIL